MLTEEEMALFGPVDPDELAAARVAVTAEWLRDKVRDAMAEDDTTIPPPQASVPEAQPVVCQGCGVTLTAENGSHRDGKWTHVGCPANDTPIVPAGGSSGEKCPDCPHPAHPGVKCERKRGRGQCQCGVGRTSGGEPTADDPPSDAYARLQAAPEVPSVTGGAAEEDVAAWAEQHDAKLKSIDNFEDAPLKPSIAVGQRPSVSVGFAEGPRHPLAGTLRIEIDLSDRAAALLERLLGR